METFDSFLTLCFSNMSKEDKRVFKSYGLDALYSLAKVKVNWTMLYASTYFWDSELHVFRFHRNEICPTHEEFCALFGVQPSGPFIFPYLRQGYVSSFASLLEISTHDAMAFIKDNMVDLNKLATSFLPLGRSCGLPLSRPRQHALAFCLIGRFLITNGTLFVPIEICELVIPLSQSRNIIPMVLAETLNGLDKVQDRFEANFEGSPLLLHMWLLERLNLLPPPSVVNYGAQHFRLRVPEFPLDASPDEWLNMLYHTSWRSIRWHIPYWKCNEKVLLRTVGCTFIKLMGLKATSFYWPSRILRQFGAIQTIPNHQASTTQTNSRQVHPVQPVSQSLVKWMEDRWNGWNSATLVPNTGGPYELSKEYKKWLSKDIGHKETTMRAQVAELIGIPSLGSTKRSREEDTKANKTTGTKRTSQRVRN